MFRWISLLIFRWQGWKIDTNLPPNIKRCVMIAAPHTSNWDVFYTVAAFAKLKIPIKFTIKKEWTRFPFNFIFGSLAIAIDRAKTKNEEQRKSKVTEMVELFDKNPNELVIIITPEATRKRNEQWKTGFYQVALQANVPIGLGYVDYKLKKAGIGGVIIPTGDIKADLAKVMAFYQTINAKHPKNFSIDTNY